MSMWRIRRAFMAIRRRIGGRVRADRRPSAPWYHRVVPKPPSSHPMVCTRCGSEVPASANGCPRCNAGRLRTTATGVETPPPPVAAHAASHAAIDPDPLTTVLPPFDSSAGLIDAPTMVPRGVAPARIADAQTMIPGAPAVQQRSDIDAPTAAPGMADGPIDRGPLDPGSAFGARYHIIRLLGIGGMGAVYQAWDAELGVSVA